MNRALRLYSSSTQAQDTFASPGMKVTAKGPQEHTICRLDNIVSRLKKHDGQVVLTRRYPDNIDTEAL